MIEDPVFLAQVNKAIKYLAMRGVNNPVTVRNLESRLGLPNETTRRIRDHLLRYGFIQERFTTNLTILNPNGKSEITYRITQRGMNRYHELLREEIRERERQRQVAEYRAEEERTKKSNRRWIIGCTIAIIVMMTVAILVGISF
ncbi:MAG: hypothetical protein GF308_00580 [Candidatus Heimdallarchaeota archaeon]|nr:hypothetical protein [Candidatus Heimdallarchaeota archaeon]